MKITTACAHVEPHDLIDIKNEGETATLYINGGACYLPIADLTKAQVLRLLAQASDCLARWPEHCTVCDGLATGTVRVPTGADGVHEYDDLPACDDHRDDEFGVRAA